MTDKELNEKLVSEKVLGALLEHIEQQKSRDAIRLRILLLLIVAMVLLGFVLSLLQQQGPVIEPVVEPNEQAELWNVSAYCPCEKCCGIWATKGINSKGQRVFGDQTVITPGALAVAAPPEIPFGSVLDVPGYGRAVVRDRGGAIKGNKLDLFFNTHQEALEWGRQFVPVTFDRGNL